MTVDALRLFKGSQEDCKTAFRRTKGSRRQSHKILSPWICFNVKKLTTFEDNHFLRKRETFLLMLIIILFLSAEADQHDNIRQAVVCKRRGSNCVVRRPQCVTFWTYRPNKCQGLIIFSLYVYSVEIDMFCLKVRLERCNSTDFIFLNAETFL